MNESEPSLLNLAKDKDEEAIQFVPNISSLPAEEVEFWINALQSGKDVQFSLSTSENGLLQITLINPNDDCVNEVKSEVNLNCDKEDIPSDSPSNTDLLKNDSSKCVEWGLFRNSKGNIVAHPIQDVVENSEEKLASFESLLGSNEASNCQPTVSNNVEHSITNRSLLLVSKGNKSNKDAVLSNETKKSAVDKESNKTNDSTIDTNSKIIVTVAIDDASNPDENLPSNSPTSPADPNCFPCVRSEWYVKPPKRKDKALVDDQCEVNTTVVADDMRCFLKYNSISLANFSQHYLQRSQGTLSDVLNHPKPWNGLSARGRSIYLKMMQFLKAENLDEVVSELQEAYSNVRPGPLTSILPANMMGLLQKKQMPSARLIEEAAMLYSLNTLQLRSYCEEQLKKHPDSMDVMELENKKNSSSSDRGASTIQKNKKILKSGFQPRSCDRQICPVFGCGYILSAKLSLEHHLLTHSGERPFKCEICENRFSTASNLRTHKRRHENEPHKISKRALKAAMVRKACEAASSSNVIEEGKHIVSDFSNDIEKLSSRVKLEQSQTKLAYTCGVCSRRFSSKHSLHYHVTGYHPAAKMKDNDRLFICHICTKSFKTKASLFIHLRSHDGDRPFHCKFCKKRFFTKTNCVRHTKTHTGVRPYKCSKCNAKFTEASSVATHMRIHTGEKPFVCETCGKRFSQSGSLIAHRLLHTGRRPYLCETCGLSFRQKANLLIHEHRHLGIRRHVCMVCSHASKSKGELQQHLLQHTNERPYVCNVCPLTFTRLHNLKEHVHKFHDRAPYKCDRCGLGFPTKSSLAIHQEMESESHTNITNASKVDELDCDEGIDDAIVTVPEYASPILQVLTDPMCCLSPLSPTNNTTTTEDPASISSIMASSADPSLSVSNSSSAFSLNSNDNVPVAIVMERGLTFSSVDRALLESGRVVSTDVNLQILPDGDTNGTVVADSSDPNMQSVIVAAEDCDQLESGARYVVVSVSDDVTSLGSNPAFSMTSVTLEKQTSD